MISNKVLITYKRKRFSSNANRANVVKVDSSVETAGEHCFRCGSVDVNENLLVCHSCSGSYHLRCVDCPSKYIPEERWLCSPCTTRCDVEASLQHRPHQTGKIIEKKNVGKSETGSMKPHSQKELSSPRLSEDSSREGSPSPVDPSIKKVDNASSMDKLDTDSASACRVIEETSRSQSTILETLRRSNSIGLNSWTERNAGSRFSEDCVSTEVSSDKRSSIVWNSDYPKEKTNTSLITFHRRVKKKQDVANASVARTSRAEDKQSSMVTGELGDSCKCADSTVLLEAAGPCQLHAIQQDMNVRIDAGLEPKFAGQGAADKCKEPCLQRLHVAPQDTVPLQPSEHLFQCQSDKSIGMPTSDATKDTILLHESKQSGMAITNTSMREEKGNELVSEERGHASEAELLVAPDDSTYLTNSKPSKPLVDVMAENFQEPQTSSTQTCALVIVGEETEGRINRSQWLETLDKSLEDAKNGINLSTHIDKSSISCRLASNGGASPMNLINSTAKIQLNQDVSTECMNQISRLQERLLITKSNNSTYGKQQHERASKNSSMYTDFLDLSRPLNSDEPEISVNDFRGMSLPLDLSVKDTVNRYNRHLRWHSMGENASSRQKQLYENDLIGSQMLKESTLLDKFKRFSHEWSEEELDYLWIGVRRHGLNNWSAILKDPKFYFSESRVAEDLAEQWDKEQIKLLNGTLYQPIRPSTSDLLGPHNMDDGCWGKAAASNLYRDNVVSSYSEFPPLKAETKLSLGGVYVQSENNTNRNVPHLSGLCTPNPLAIKNSTANPFIGSNLIGSTNPRGGIRQQNAFKTQYARYNCESSTSPQKSVERVAHERRSAANSTLPHWLKEVLTMPQRQSSFPLPSGVSSLDSANMINNDELVTAFPSAGEPPALPKDSRGRGILKRKSMTSRKNASGVKLSENSVSADKALLQKRFSLLPNLGLTPLKSTSVSTGSRPSDDVLDLNNASSDPTGPSNLVVIDSDASSEETISDDQGSRW